MMWGFGWMWFMPLFMVTFWGLVIWAVVALVQGLPRPRGSDSGIGRKDSALGDIEAALRPGRDLQGRNTKR